MNRKDNAKGHRHGIDDKKNINFSLGEVVSGEALKFRPCVISRRHDPLSGPAVFTCHVAATPFVLGKNKGTSKIVDKVFVCRPPNPVLGVQTWSIDGARCACAVARDAAQGIDKDARRTLYVILYTCERARPTIFLLSPEGGEDNRYFGMLSTPPPAPAPFFPTIKQRLIS